MLVHEVRYVVRAVRVGHLAVGVIAVGVGDPAVEMRAARAGPDGDLPHEKMKEIADHSAWCTDNPLYTRIKFGLFEGDQCSFTVAWPEPRIDAPLTPKEVDSLFTLARTIATEILASGILFPVEEVA